MAKNKTTETNDSVAGFINSVEDETKRTDSFQIIELFKKQTGYEPKLWGTSIVGFGSYHYKYASGHEGDAPLTGFSPRKDSIALYFPAVFERKEELLQQFGKHKTGKGCIYIKKLADVNQEVFKEIITSALAKKKDNHSVE